MRGFDTVHLAHALPSPALYLGGSLVAVILGVTGLISTPFGMAIFIGLVLVGMALQMRTSWVATDRTLERRDWVPRCRRSVELSKIVSVEARDGGWGVFGTGEVVVEVDGDEPMILHNVGSPKRVAQRITTLSIEAKNPDSFVSRKRWRRIKGMAGTAFGLVWVVLVGYLAVSEMTNPKGAQMRVVLERESEALPTFPLARLVDSHESNKGTTALVDASYSTQASMSAVAAFYRYALEQRGWRSCGDTPTYDWGRDQGGHTYRFCKDDMHVDLQWAGDRANAGWTYAVSFSYGLH